VRPRSTLRSLGAFCTDVRRTHGYNGANARRVVQRSCKALQLSRVRVRSISCAMGIWLDRSIARCWAGDAGERCILFCSVLDSDRSRRPPHPCFRCLRRCVTCTWCVQRAGVCVGVISISILSRLRFLLFVHGNEYFDFCVSTEIEQPIYLTATHRPWTHAICTSHLVLEELFLLLQRLELERLLGLRLRLRPLALPACFCLLPVSLSFSLADSRRPRRLSL
jgi:hypothetical protein